jgi:hypothetical protein
MLSILQALKLMLDHQGLNWYERSGVGLLVPLELDHETVYVNVTALEDAQIAAFRVPQFVTARGTSADLPLFRELLELNARLSVGRFVYESKTGEVALEVLFPLGGDGCSLRQLELAFAAVENCPRRYRTRLRQLAETGRPPSESVDDTFWNLLGDLPDGPGS